MMTFLNCGRCWKCVEHLYDIEAIGKLKEINAIFDLDEYNNNKDQLFEFLASSRRKREIRLPGMMEKIPLIEAQGGKIPKILLEYQNGLQIDRNPAHENLAKRKKWFFK